MRGRVQSLAVSPCWHLLFPGDFGVGISCSGSVSSSQKLENEQIGLDDDWKFCISILWSHSVVAVIWIKVDFKKLDYERQLSFIHPSVQEIKKCWEMWTTMESRAGWLRQRKGTCTPSEAGQTGGSQGSQVGTRVMGGISLQKQGLAHWASTKAAGLLRSEPNGSHTCLSLMSSFMSSPFLICVRLKNMRCGSSLCHIINRNLKTWLFCLVFVSSLGSQWYFPALAVLAAQQDQWTTAGLVALGKLHFAAGYEGTDAYCQCLGCLGHREVGICWGQVDNYWHDLAKGTVLAFIS